MLPFHLNEFLDKNGLLEQCGTRQNSSRFMFIEILFLIVTHIEQRYKEEEQQKNESLLDMHDYSTGENSWSDA